MSDTLYTVLWTTVAREMLAGISDRRVRVKIFKRVGDLATGPDKQGKPLVGSLAGFRSLRAGGQRFRIIYRIEDERVVVYIVAVGLRAEGSRKDIYALAKRLVRLGIVGVKE